jgi:nicotinamidase-related amidase
VTGQAIAGFHGRVGAGRRPALLVIDMSVGFTDPESPLACDLDAVVGAIARLLDDARRVGAPVVYTTVAYGEADRAVARAFIDKVPALLTLEAGSRFAQIDPRVAPRTGEPVLNKLFASAFFGTPLAALLAAAGCDSAIVTGASTSGCVRATVVDVLQNGYRPLVAREAVGDRNTVAHDQALYDIDAKYGDVIDVDEACAVLARGWRRT